MKKVQCPKCGEKVYFSPGAPEKGIPPNYLQGYKILKLPMFGAVRNWQMHKCKK